jgi:hypothetical protein
MPPVDPETAREFARAYVALVEALLREGVPEGIARYEARCTAALLLFGEDADSEAWELPDAETEGD